MSEFIATLFALFVLNPLQAEIGDRLQGMAAGDVIGAGRACVAAEGPRLLERAQANWGWAAAHAIGVSFGVVDPINLLTGDNADCRRVLALLKQGDGEA
ncbi:hypothetical protein BJF93_22650 [Xaviernesmea oryzae]|uniref:Uncharacterized protein n=1 Tax=Xaviernesmea oryzae TaxID=464029 RepID=A0A1Q9B3A5_9HYPH|nr:hypothetical protein [Xaviernesmea oryzae]OLP62483.1 hypothetical protein BJF93_22650 [Xaviernesmea oryzae]SEM17198.1 hypothetical protein SAMN04487976_12160 [Xaviernesmea oryzae]